MFHQNWGKTWTKRTICILSSTWECWHTGHLKDAVSHIRNRWKSGVHYRLTYCRFSFHMEKKEKDVLLSDLAHYDLSALFSLLSWNLFLMPLQTHRQIFFDSWTKLEFPSSLHLAQRETTIKSISLHFPKDWLHRDDICLLFILRLMWIFIKNRLPTYVFSRSGKQALWMNRLTYHLYYRRRKVFIGFICCLLSFATSILLVDKIFADVFWWTLNCLADSALQIQLQVPSHRKKTCTKSLFTHICHIRERIKLIACAILQAFESMSFRLKVMRLITLQFPLQAQLDLLCSFFVAHAWIWILSHFDLYCVW